ncbi:MAG: hydroxymethylglutaryl-CoA lyase [Omnitrophica WOR_2 bacterium]
MKYPESEIRITETPRDAQQGLPYIIPFEKRAAYINTLLKVGFDVIDFGSFVSPKAIPQMDEQERVLQLVDKAIGSSKLMAIVGNLRGGKDAASQEKLDIIGFPFSMSETFLQKNINSSLPKAIETVDSLALLCADSNKELRIFMSMAFGNPYGDKWSSDEMEELISVFIKQGIKTITLSDTIGVATPDSITEIFNRVLSKWPEIEFGLHLHTTADDWYDKIEAAWLAGCRSFDTVINGIGGCPMTGYEMIGNLDTLNLYKFINDFKISSRLDERALGSAIMMAAELYNVPFKN